MKFKKKYKKISYGKLSESFILINILVALFYFTWWLNFNNADNKILYFLLLFGEIYHVFMAISFWHTIFPAKDKVNLISENGENNFLSVDIFITVAGEPAEIVRQTVVAAAAIRYPNFRVYILNDGLVAKKNNWQEIELLAKELDICCITRKVPGGAKAGNINNALKITDGQLVVILDADMVPKPNFLSKTVPFFKDQKMGFVQTPQYYKNQQNNLITAGAWAQQDFFFGAIMKGKEKSNASFICGTNFIIRRKALIEVGGMQENNIAEDFLTSLLVHNKGWKSYYLNEVFCEGLAPEDMLSYFKQQLRWARGSLEVIFTKNNPLFKKGLNWHQKIEYISSALFYFNGVIVLIDMVIPLIFLFFGLRPVTSSSTSFAIFFIPFMFLNLYSLRMSSVGKVSFQALSFSQSGWYLQILAFKSILLKQPMKFEVTSKRALSGNYLNLVYPHIIYIILGIMGSMTAIIREGVNSSVLTNLAWFSVNSVLFIPFILAAYKPQGLNNKNYNKALAINE